MPTFHKTYRGWYSADLNNFNLRIGTPGNVWSGTEVLENDIPKPRGWIKA
jgi:hypothetical protein